MYTQDEFYSFLNPFVKQYLEDTDDTVGFYMEIAMNAKDEDHFNRCIDYCNENIKSSYKLREYFKDQMGELFDKYYQSKQSYYNTADRKWRVLEFVPTLALKISFDEIYENPDVRMEEVSIIQELNNIKEDYLLKESDNVADEIINGINAIITNLENDNVASWIKMELVEPILDKLPELTLPPAVQERITQVLQKVEKLHRADVILGTFMKNEGFTRGGKIPYGTITLYPKSINRVYPRSEIKGAKSVFMHELFHAFHYCTMMHKDGWNDGENVGKIVKESLASYFEYTYAFDVLNDSQIARSIQGDWGKYALDEWPYTGASYILQYAELDDKIFSKIFMASLSGWESAYNAIIACHDLLESEEYKLLSGL